MKKLLSAMALGLALVVGVGAEAGSIPTNRVPLQTYAIKRVNCYLQPNGTQKGWIDPGDYVVVTQIRSDGWAYGSYPVGRGRASRWFRANDLVNNVGFANQDRYSPKANTAVYRNPNYSQSMGSFNNNESIVVVSDSGQSRQVIYKLSNGSGYKMGWVPYWDCWSAEQAGKNIHPINYVNNNGSFPGQNIVNLSGSGDTYVDTFNGVSAVYPRAYYGGNTDSGTYSCARYVSKYYSSVYGVNLSYLYAGNPQGMKVSRGRIYKVNDGSVKAGDIVNFAPYKGGVGKYGHWAIAKGLEGNNIVIIEQNYRINSKSQTYKNRRVNKNDVQIFRWQSN